MTPSRLVATGVGALLLLCAAPAVAHTPVESYWPARGATADRGLRTAVVTFKSRIAGGKLTVRAASGAVVSSGAASVSGSRLRVRLRGGKRAGSYRGEWRALHTDGHVTRGSWPFRLR